MKANLIGNTSFKSMAIIIGGHDEANAIREAADGHMQGLEAFGYPEGNPWVIATGDADKNTLADLRAQIKDEFKKGGKTVEAVFEQSDTEGKIAWFKLWKDKIDKLNLPKFDPEEAYHFFKDAILRTAKSA